MEQWEALLEVYPEPADPKSCNKAIRTADNLLKKDLADFEIERILDTLLYQPVCLLGTISSYHSVDSWCHVVRETFKLLADVVTKHSETVQPYCEDIIRICPLQFDSEGQKNALLCLERVARVYPCDGTLAARLINQLEYSDVCKTQLALIVGTVCECHPETVEHEVTRIWRIYLRMLESKKNSDTLTSAILQGLSGLFHSFGPHLPTSELNLFYDTLIKYIDTSKCNKVIITILEKYAYLFKERLSADVNIRRWLWETVRDKKDNAIALRTIYEAAVDVLNKDRAQNVLNSEVLPRAEATDTNTKFTALRILVYMERKGFSFGDLARLTDIHSLEFQLRCGSISYDIAEEISWCIESNLANSDKLLQTAILFYENLPNSKRVDVISRGILEAPDDVRADSIVFLTTETIQPSDTGDGVLKYIEVWRNLMMGTHPASGKVLEEFVAHVTFVLETFFEEGGEEVPDRLSSLLSLTSQLVPLSPPQAVDVWAALAPPVGRCEAATALATLAAIAEHLSDSDSLGDVCKGIEISRCKDEATLCAACLLVIRAPAEPEQVLLALQVIFSRNDVEWKTFLEGLEKLNYLIVERRECLDEDRLHNVIRSVEKLRVRIDLAQRDGRVLHRRILMFLGKYGRKTDVNNNRRTSSSVIAKLKDALSLRIPHADQGKDVKINLRSVLELAVEEGETDVLYQLLTVLCAHPNITSSSKTGEAICAGVALVCRAVCSRLAAGGRVRGVALHHAALRASPRALPALLQYISEETSPGARRMLTELVGVVLQSGSDEGLHTAAERAQLMLASTHSITRRAGLDITDILLSALKRNDSLTRTLLPRILELISSTNELETVSTFELASRTYVEKIALFDVTALRELMKNIINNLMVHRKLNTESDIKIYNNLTAKSLSFIKEAIESEKQECAIIYDSFFDVYDCKNFELYQCIYVLATMRNRIGLHSSYYSNMLTRSDLLERVYAIEDFDVDASSAGPDLFKLDAVLMFFIEYAANLLELHYKKTVDFLAKIIKNLKSENVIHSHKILENCIAKYRNILKFIPSSVQSSFEDWCQRLPLEKITLCVIKQYPEKSSVTTVKALSILLSVFESKPILKEVENWHTSILSNYHRVETRHMSFLTDCLTVAVRYLTDADVKSTILEGVNLKGVRNERVGIKFCTRFIHVLVPFLNRILLEPGLEECCSILDDIVRFYVRKRSLDASEVVILVDKLWPVYEARTNFHQKRRLLYNMSCLPKKLGPDSNPLRWVADQLASDTSRECKTSLVTVLPSGEGFSACYAQFASSCLPATLAEVRGGARAALRAALDALAANGDLKLLDIVLTLADSDDTRGWWDEAMACCAASLARSERMEMYEAAYRRCWGGLTLGVCQRIMVPLLRYATPAFCERFFSTTIQDLLRKLRLIPRVSAASLSLYHKCVVDRIRALTLLQVAFEKIPLQSLQSPQAILYSETEVKDPYYLIREGCKLCVTLRLEDCPAAADDALRADFKRFQYKMYNCLSAAICKRRPVEKFYESILSRQAWSRLCDESVTYKLPIFRSKRKTRHSVSVEVGQGGDYLSSGSVRTRMFLRTLSDDPLNYDLTTHEEFTQVVTQDLELTDNELSQHACAATLTAVVAHVAAHSHTQWLRELVAALDELHDNTRWLLAQAIINCKEELRQHANVLCPALLKLVANTPREEGGRKRLNGLHVDILDTVTKWCEDPECGGVLIPNSSHGHLNTAIEYLVCTTIDIGERFLLDLVEKLIELYGNDVTVPWRCFEGFLEGSPIDSYQNKNSLSILKRLTKRKIYIPELVPTLVKYDKYWSQEYKMAELFGLAVMLESDKEAAMRQFKKILDRTRQKIDEYVKILYYAQQGCPGICDERQFRTIVDQTPKVKPLKSKCLQIISKYISQKLSPDEYITSMFDTIELNELLSSTDNIEAMGVVKSGFHLMEEGIKRRAVMQIAEYCHHPEVKVRQAAYEVMVKAFEDLLNSVVSASEGSPPAKKIKKKALDILNMVHGDAYAHTVLSRVANTDNVACDVIRRLTSGDLRVRFAECLLLCLYMPLTNHHRVSPKIPLLEMLFGELRTNEQFLEAKLSNEPLDNQSPTDDIIRTASSKLLTKSAMFQGSFRTYRTSTYSGRTRQSKAPTDPGIDVQITIDSILDALLTFAKNNTEVQRALTVEIFKALGNGSGSSLYKDTAEQLAAMLALPPSDVTPLLVQLARVTVDCRIDGFQDTVLKLKETTARTEGEEVTRCLYEEVRLRCLGPEQFVLGSISHESDVNMRCETNDFSLKDLISCFGNLSNWNKLTIQQKCDIQNCGLPSFWTDVSTFKRELERYEVNSTKNWFDKMVTLYKKGCERDSERWLSEMDRWPVKRFDVSAVTEAISWNSEKPPTSDIHRSDCLAEWAARLQIRCAYKPSHDTDSSVESQTNDAASRSHELLWCVRANEMALPALTLQCVRRNERLLEDDERPAWEYQKLLALRAIGLKDNDSSHLREALRIAESNAAMLTGDVPKIVGFHQLVLSLHQDLNSLTLDKVQNVMNNIDVQYVGMSVTNKQTLRSLYELAMNFYNDSWPNEACSDRDALLQNMAGILNRVASSNPGDADMYLAVVLNRLDSYDGRTLDDRLARVLLDQFQRLLPYLDEFSREQMRTCWNLFPPRVLAEYNLQELFDDGIEMYKKYFALIRDPKHSLRQYCKELLDALNRNDRRGYGTIFCRIRDMLDNPYGGTTYQLLRRQRDVLYNVEDFSMPKQDIQNVLKQLRTELEEDTTTLRLSQLCPSLALASQRGCEWDAYISRFLSLGPLKVVKFDERVSIFVDSVRRPAVVSVLTSDGCRRRCLFKAGESLRLDAAAHRVSRLLRDVRTYNVTPLSEDSGLVEFLVDHERVYSLISSKCRLNNVKMSLPHASDKDLIFDNVPAYTLRAALEDHSSSLQDFIAKKSKFQDTLASATVHGWLLGLGDRHLENILCSTTDGAVCYVDWGASLQYGSHELLPARLTRNLLAVCDPQVLESRIQDLMTSLRDSHKLYSTFIKMSFKWMGPEFDEKFVYIQNILSGAALSWHITRTVIEKSERKDKKQYLKLLDQVFQDYCKKDLYSVLEQVSCLLRHCTDPRILSVTRTNWEPWT
ncbi:uncharacterized protein LOC113513711 isoform X2 [Galleria mellonella]|nr:uncharacterized protein LOC113513711 isoform X2 [Galleria mellonella]XP_052757247.1 uncharacterized protein LOC113513711 isoform X2 [Galleria mellonella]